MSVCDRVSPEFQHYKLQKELFESRLKALTADLNIRKNTK